MLRSLVGSEMCIRDRCWDAASQSPELSERIRRALHIAELREITISIAASTDASTSEADELGRLALELAMEHFHALVEQTTLGYSKLTLPGKDRLAMYAVYDLITRKVALAICTTGPGIPDGCDVAMAACREMLGHEQPLANRTMLDTKSVLRDHLAATNSKWKSSALDARQNQLQQAKERANATGYDETSYASEAVSPRSSSGAGSILYLALAQTVHEPTPQLVGFEESSVSTPASVKLLETALSLASTEHIAQVLENHALVQQRVGNLSAADRPQAPESTGSETKPPARAPVVKGGTLHKRAGEKSNTWKSKHVTLTEHDLTYAPVDAPKETKSLSLGKFVSVEYLGMATESPGIFSCATGGSMDWFSFRITVKTDRGVHRKQYEFRTSSESEMASWLAAIDQNREVHGQEPLSPTSLKEKASLVRLEDCGMEEVLEELGAEAEEPEPEIDCSEVGEWLRVHASNLQHHAASLARAGILTLSDLKQCEIESLERTGLTSMEQQQLVLTAKSVLLLPRPPSAPTPTFGVQR
eukprot:TRINITY_DN24074_c0_g2_i1.p1 TRINITY_DN24074_c0_g2~~TRINITY_DN24074_c0_g2_i1.p1  ORF type:complete len:566 (-),score=147.32 TRINITY_DN24074_c0_g2_i1:235-1830(-)